MQLRFSGMQVDVFALLTEARQRIGSLRAAIEAKSDFWLAQSVFLLSSYLIDPGASLPKVNEMTDFNMWTFNSRVFPGIDPLPVRLGDRVRLRIGNLTMTNHPIHLHGHRFSVSCTDGGWVPDSAQWPEVTTDIPVGAMRAVDLVADHPGDWALHCHKAHHTMNAMGHDMRNLIGVSKQDLAKAVGRLAPDAMVMGSTGMAMGDMEMPAPDNTLPMMTGSGPFGPIEMGGMFTVMKIREGMAHDNYRDPGPYRHATGTVAYEVDAQSTEAPRQENKQENKQDNNNGGKPPRDTKEMKPRNMEGMRGMRDM
jgi:hypothetical protein